MRTYFMLVALCLLSLTSFSQKSELAKASPFTAVKWKNDRPIVLFNNEWYTLEKLDVYTTEEILDFCKLEFDDKWQKRFSEDLVEILIWMGSPPQVTVTLVLASGKEQKTVKGTYTLENRKKVFAYNKANAEY